MGKTRDVFKKIGYTNRTFHAKMGTIKNRIGKDLTDAEEIKKRSQEYTEELYKKGLNDMDLIEAEEMNKRWQGYAEELYRKELNDPDNHNGVITHLEPDILECEVKLASESITKNKASGGDGIPAELFQIVKDDAVKVLHSIYQQIWETQ